MILRPIAFPSWRIPRIALVAVFAGAVVVAAAPRVNAAPTTSRAAAETAISGISIQEHAAQQATLRTLLVADMPAGVLAAPIVIELTDQDRANLAAPTNVNGPAPLRIGVVKAISPAVQFGRGQQQLFGAVSDANGGGVVWAQTFSSPGAQAIRLHFTGFSLPSSAEMFFFSTVGEAYGPYTSKGRNGNGDFWTRSITGESGIVQLRFTANATEADRRKISFAITELGHISGRITGEPTPVTRSHDTWPCSDNVACLVDANCVNGTPADGAKSAVAKMEWIQGAFINTCTGGLLVDTDPSTQIPYFLTANHCFSSSISNLETFFFYSTDSCNGVCPDSLVTGGTPPPASTIGVTVQATGSAGDFTLLTLDEVPPAGVTYLGWNNTPVASTNGASLYRISNANFGPQVYSQHDVDTSSPECTGWPRGERIYAKDITGATMGGSSGSPVLNSAGEVVGQLSGCCGFNCANECDAANNWTVDGAMAFYWDQVAPFLNPTVGCTTNADCDDADACNGLETCVAGSCQAGTPLNCGDANACTADSCDAATGCVNNPINCDDSNLCTNDSCDTATGCVNAPVSCPPGEACNPANGLCEPQVCNNDGTCDAGEDCNNCPNDCISGGGTASCGDGVCNGTEDCVSCPGDCNGKQKGKANRRFCCNADGGSAGDNPVTCSDSRCTSSGFQCGGTSAPFCCGDGVCEGGEDGTNCSIDCGAPPVCGDATCDAGEDECSCPADCCAGAPASEAGLCNDGCDNDCDGLTDGADPDCACGGRGAACSLGSDCCSGNCKRNGTCR